MSYRNAAFTIGVCQMAVMGGMVLFFPSVKVETFVFFPHVSNGTLDTKTTGECNTHVTRIMLGLPCLAMAVAVAAFTSSTYNLIECEMMPTGEYCKENIENMTVWDALFWFSVTAFHTVCVFAATTPVDLFAGASSAYLMSQFLQRLCAPMIHNSSDAMMGGGGGGAHNMQISHTSANVIGFLVGFMLMLYCIPGGPAYMNRSSIVMIVAVLDYLMWIGHTMDRSPKMETITSCRLVWVCLASLSLAAVYGAWHDSILIPSHVYEDDDVKPES